jgi:hypothetical protein
LFRTAFTYGDYLGVFKQYNYIINLRIYPFLMGL